MNKWNVGKLALLVVLGWMNVDGAQARPMTACDFLAAFYNQNGYRCNEVPWTNGHIYDCSGQGSAWRMQVRVSESGQLYCGAPPVEN